MAASQRGDIEAIVSRGGRPDLAGEALGHVAAPTLLIVGSLDTYVIELNRLAQSQMYAENELRIIGGASHLFEEPGTLEQAGRRGSGLVPALPRGGTAEAQGGVTETPIRRPAFARLRQITQI